MSSLTTSLTSLSFFLTFLTFLSTSVLATCYFPNGEIALLDVACVASASDSACCYSNQACLSNGLCMTGEVDGIQQYARGTCTDQNWLSGACPNFCMDQQDLGKAVVSCNTTGVDRYCCNEGCSCEENGIDQVVSFTGEPYTLTVIGVAGTYPNPSATPAQTSESIPSSLDVRTTTSDTSSVQLGTVTSTTTSTPAPQQDDNSNSHDVAIGVGVGLGIGVFLLIVAALFFCAYRRRRRAREQNGLSGKEVVDGNQVGSPKYYGHVAKPGKEGIYRAYKGGTLSELNAGPQEDAERGGRYELPAEGTSGRELTGDNGR